MLEPRSVYELEGKACGKRLWIIAPGPSSDPYDEYRERIEDSDDFIVAVNSALEFTTPDIWMWADKRFGWLYGHEIHDDGQGGPCPVAMVCPSHQRKMRERFKGERLWVFDYQMKLRPWEEIVGDGARPEKPVWYSPTRRFLPGRASVVNNAISLAWLMEPRICILVGVDWKEKEGVYYRPGIQKNKGPEDRERALAAGFKFFKSAIKTELWPDLDLTTVADPVVERGVRQISWDEAFDA